MKKKLKQRRLGTTLLNFDLKMKLTMLLLFTTLLGLHANESYAQKAKVSLDVENATVKEVIDNIESNTKFKFVYNIKHVNLQRRLSLKFKQENIDKVLGKLFGNTNTNYKVRGTQVILWKSQTKKDSKSSSLGRISVESVLVQSNVSGTITDNDGAPLPGANILEKGTTNGTQTDFDGNFSINADGNGILIVSYLGFASQEVEIGGRSTVNVSLMEDSNQLDEIVLVGYGSQSKVSVTNSISSVNNEELSETPAINVQQALQGRAAGVQVTNSGTPGTSPLVTIRGLGTFGNSTPLYVVDGVPVNNLNSIPPESIESVDVLKDASSAAIYGSRGSNGVVLIKTKGGEQGRNKISFSTYAGLASNPKTIPLLNAEQYRQYASEAYDADPVTPGNQIYPALQPGNYDPDVDTDWQDEAFRTGFVQNYDVQASGGSEKGTYGIRAGYLKQEGSVMTTDYERYSLGLNSSLNLGDKVKVGQTLNLGIGERNEGTGIYSWMLKMSPTVPVWDESTNYYSTVMTSYDGQDAKNVVQLLNTETAPITETSIIGSVFGSWEIVDGLTYKISIGLDHSYYNRDYFSPSIPTGTTQRDYAETSKTRQKYLSTVITNTLNYTKTFNNMHNVDILAGYESNKSTFDEASATSQNDLTDFVEQLNAAAVTEVSSYSSQNNLQSVFGRIAYNYNRIFLLSTTIRTDGSSRFGASNRWGIFPSVSGGVNFGKWLLEDNNLISNLKLRGSWGISGNNNIGDYLYDYGLQTNYNYVINDELVSGTRPSRMSNPNLRWEELTATDVGVDFGMFNNALTLTMDYFVNKSDGLLVAVPTPPSSGDTAGSLTQNVGGTESKGFEFTLGYQSNKEDFSWGVNTNLGTLSSNVTSLGSVEAIFSGNLYQQDHSRLAVGEPLLHFFGYKTDGIFQNQAEVDSHATQNEAEPGNIRYVDTNGDGVIDSDDRVVIGDPNPQIIAGLDFNMKFKNFDASVFFNGAYGNEIYNGSRYMLEQQARLYNMSTVVLDRWSPSNPSNTIPKATPGFLGNELVSDRFIEDGSYTRLRSITLGYSIPQVALKSLADGVFSNLRFYVSGQNLFTWTNYSGYDPEIQADNLGGTVSAMGLDRGAYPQPRTILAGIQVEF